MGSGWGAVGGREMLVGGVVEEGVVGDGGWVGWVVVGVGG